MDNEVMYLRSFEGVHHKHGRGQSKNVRNQARGKVRALEALLILCQTLIKAQAESNKDP
jgi:hypothetical protein